MRDSKNFDYNLLAILAISILLMLLHSINIFSSTYSYVNDILAPINTKVNEAVQNISLTYKSLVSFNSLKRQNADYEKEVLHLRSEVTQMQVRIEELEFQLKESPFIILDQNYKYLSARVLRLNRNSSEVELFISKGKREGVVPGQNVIYEKYLIGLVIEVFEHNSVVRAVGSNNLKIPVITGSNNISGLLEHNQLEGLIISNILPNEVVTQGETILTSGKSGDFLYGLMIGDLGTRLSGESESIQRFRIGSYLNIDSIDFVTIVIE